MKWSRKILYIYYSKEYFPNKKCKLFLTPIFQRCPMELRQPLFRHVGNIVKHLKHSRSFSSFPKTIQKIWYSSRFYSIDLILKIRIVYFQICSVVQLQYMSTKLPKSNILPKTFQVLGRRQKDINFHGGPKLQYMAINSLLKYLSQSYTFRLVHNRKRLENIFVYQKMPKIRKN